MFASLLSFTNELCVYILQCIHRIKEERVHVPVKCSSRCLRCNDKALISALRGNDDADFYTLFPTVNSCNPTQHDSQ